MNEHELTHTTTRPPADATHRGNTYGTYGCCSPDAAFIRACPLTHGAFVQRNHDVCGGVAGPTSSITHRT